MVVSESGKEATLTILSEGEFVGEGALAGQALRIWFCEGYDGLRIAPD